MEQAKNTATCSSLNDQAVARIAACGFRPPCFRYEKPDPRGSEHGWFLMSHVPNTAEMIEVEKSTMYGVRVYRMRFENLTEFECWAMAET